MNKKLIIPLFLCFLVFISCSSVKEDWQKAESENSVQAYQEFVVKHPNNTLAAEAKQKIMELSFAEAEAKETPQALNKFIIRFRKGPLVEKARRKLEDHYYQVAENKNTIVAYEKFVKRFPKSEHSEQAKAKMEAMYFEQAERVNTYASYRTFLDKYKKGKWAEKAFANFLVLKSAVHPLLKEVRTLGIRVNEHYSNAENVHIPFDRIVKKIALYSGCEFIENDDMKADAIVEISVSGKALSAYYTGGQRYAGATFSGTMILKVDQTTVAQRSFSATVEPPNLIIGYEGETLSKAPFSALLYREHSFIENFLIMMGKAFGCHVILPYLNDADTATSERVVVAIVEVAGKSAYDIFENLSGHEEPHIQQAAITGFGKLKDPRSVSVLEKAVETGIGTVVGAKAAHALDNMGWTPPNAEAKVWHVMAKQEYKELKKMGGAALNPLVHLLKNGERGSVREDAARWLRVLNLKDAIHPLIEVLDDEDYRVRLEAAQALGYIGNKTVVMPLIDRLNDPVGSVREYVRDALKRLTGKDLGQNKENWQVWWEENKDKDLKKN